MRIKLSLAPRRFLVVERLELELEPRVCLSGRQVRGAAPPAGRAYFIGAGMPARGVNGTKNLPTYSNSDEPRGWRIRSKSGGDGERRYPIEDVKGRIEVLKLGYSAARTFKDGDVT